MYDVTVSLDEPSEQEHRNETPPLDPILVELIALNNQRRTLDYRETQLLLQAQHTGATFRHGHRTDAWVADMAKIPLNTAKAKLRIANRLHHYYPELETAFEHGHLGWQHICAFDQAANQRIRTDLKEFIPALITLAQLATFDRWKQELNGIATRLDQDGAYNPTEDPATNQLRITKLIGGYIHLTGQFTGEHALKLQTLLNAGTERILNRYRNDQQQLNAATEHGSRATGAAGATGADGDSDAADTNHPFGIDNTGLPSRAQAAAEALIEMLETGINTPDHHGTTLSPELIVIYNTETNTLTTDNGDTLPLSTPLLRWLITAALIHPLEISNTGDPLRMGHALRYANRAQRRALTTRDGGCIFPGCTGHPPTCDAHHIDEWNTNNPIHGGPTDIENLGLLCRHHHRVTHQPGWTMTQQTSSQPGNANLQPGETRFQWTTPTGGTIYSQRHHTQQHPQHLTT